MFDVTKLNNRLSLISQTSFMMNAQTFTHLAKNGISVVRCFVISVFIIDAVQTISEDKQYNPTQNVVLYHLFTPHAQ